MRILIRPERFRFEALDALVSKTREGRPMSKATNHLFEMIATENSPNLAGRAGGLRLGLVRAGGACADF